MNACSFIAHFKPSNVCSIVFVGCIICFGELKETSSSSSSSLLASLTLRPSSNPKELKSLENLH